MPTKSSKKPRVSLVIRAFDEEKHLGNLLHAIQQQRFLDFETILVDSGSTDRTLTIAARYPVKVLHIQPGDFTFGRSLNLGLRAARGQIAVLASAHVLPLGKNWLKDLVAPFKDAKVAISYGQQRGGPGSKFSEAQHFRRWFPEHSDFDQQHSYANNANLALRLALWRKHPFDETLTGLEDLAWASYWWHKGQKIAYVAEAGVTHFHNETAMQIVNRHRREAIALKRILPKSRFTLRDFASQFLRAVVIDFGAARRQRVLLRVAAGIISFRFLQYYGTYRGYRDPAALSAELKHVFYYPPGSLEKRKPSAERRAKPIKEESRKSAKA
ncbi:MAG: glycosyltransferase family 2 protein [Anaerolineales bacterium]